MLSSKNPQRLFPETRHALVQSVVRSRWKWCRVVCGARESVGAGAIREIIEAAATDIRNVDAEAELMSAIGIRREISAVEMVLGASRVGLRSAGREQSGNRNLGDPDRC